ncbi:hypothetical protein WG66_008606 [Moniliophthora roreri]|nr:hypothetical protein WG66_008606 [Moniliophthora roreri]
MSVPSNFDGTNQQQSQFIPPRWMPSTEHSNPPAVSWTDLYSIYAITAHLTQLQVLDEGPKGIPKFKEPNVFNSKASSVTQFLQDIRNMIQLSHHSLVSDHNKCLYFSTYLGSRAPKEWYNSVELNNKELLNYFGKFMESFKKHFRDSNIVATAQNKLDKMYQTGSAAQYIARFNEWVVHLDLTNASKIHMLYHHLKASIKDAISFVSKSTRPTKFKDKCELEKKKDRKPKDTRVDSPESDPVPPSTSTATPSLSTDSTLPLSTPIEIDAMKSKHHS